MLDLDQFVRKEHAFCWEGEVYSPTCCLGISFNSPGGTKTIDEGELYLLTSHGETRIIRGGDLIREIGEGDYNSSIIGIEGPIKDKHQVEMDI